MRINAKLFLLTFAIIATVTVASAFIYNTLSKELIQKQLSKNLVNSANDFIFAYENLNAKLDEEFKLVMNEEKDFSKSTLDFIFEVTNDSVINTKTFLSKSHRYIFNNVQSVSDFIRYNNSLLIRKDRKHNILYYYGIQYSDKIISKLSEKIRAEIALSENDVLSILNPKKEEQSLLPFLSRISRELKKKNNFELIQETYNNLDYSVTHYTPLPTINSINKVDFIIFNISDEAVTFRNTMNWVTLIIVIAGLFIGVIFQFLFTTKFRNQIENISNSVNEIAEGNTNARVEVISNDELGELGNAFNNMLEEIEKRDITEKRYSEIITLINKNPNLEDLGDELLKNLVSTLQLNAGAIYIVEENSLKCFASYGIKKINNENISKTNYYKLAEERNELIEVAFKDNYPIIKTGITELKINYLFILPIVYDGKLLSILELASVSKPEFDIKEFLNKLKDQLAIGIANGKALNQLKNLVNELKELNNAYQKQNLEITKKNTELIELHEKLKKGSKELEIQTRKAIESEKIKSQFLANMSHELRTPQNSIIGLTELILKDDSTSDKTRERLNVVLRNSKKLLTLIDNILEYSKLESGNTNVTLSKFLLYDLISEASSFIEPLFLEKDVELIIELPETNYELQTDTNKIEQIIINLVGNAVKFTNNGYVKLEVKVIEEDLEIMVSDTGPGISEEDKKIIFNEFRQADGNYNRKFSGTGLGLAICKKYTNLLNGNIYVEDNSPSGSKFVVKLNNVVEKIDAVKPEINSKLNTSQELKSLIISDGNEAVKLLEDYLASYNFTVKVERSNKISTESISKYNPNFIILDVLLENRMGWQLLCEIKSSKSLNHIPIVIINLDEETNCGYGLNIYEYIPLKLTKGSVLKSLDKLEEKQGVKFRRILFIQNNQPYSQLENELLDSDIKYYNYSNFKNIDAIKEFDPEIIIADLVGNPDYVMSKLAEFYDDPYCKIVPVMAFLDRKLSFEQNKKLNNAIFETTLIKQFHPLDVLKLIKERIDLLNDFSNLKKPQNQKVERDLNAEIFDKNKIKILVVDDDRDARFTIGEIIESLGYHPIFAKDGYECLEKLENEIPELVLLDIMMPRMDGFKTIKKIRENKLTKDLKVYALTAYAMLTDKEIIEKNGFDGLFTKPINTIQLERHLNNIFKTALR